MTTISRHAAGSVTAVSSATASPTIPANSVGDVLIFSLVTSGTVSSGPAGWTLLGSATTVAGAAVYAWSIAVTSVMSGTATATMSASSTNRAQITSYTGADTAALPAAASSSGTTASTTITAPSLAYGDFVLWINGRSAASTLSAETSSAGTWTASEAAENSGTNAMTVTDGPITAGTTATLTATSSASVTWNSLVLALKEPAAVLTTTGASSLGFAPTATAATVATSTGASSLGFALTGAASTTASSTGASSLGFALAGTAATVATSTGASSLGFALTGAASGSGSASGASSLDFALTGTAATVATTSGATALSQALSATASAPPTSTMSRHAAGNVSPVSGSSVSPTIPANSVGDVLLLTLVTSGTPTAAPAGWTLVGSSTTVASCATYVYWLPVRSVLSGTVTVNLASSAINRAQITSYSGVDTATAPTGVAGASTTASTTITAPSASYGSFAVWANGRSTASTLSGEAADAGTWTAAEAGENSGTNGLTVTDGPITPGTTTLSGSSTAAVTWNSVVVAFAPAPTVTTGGSSLDYGLSALSTSGNVGAVRLSYSLAGSASTTAKVAAGSSLNYALTAAVTTTASVKADLGLGYALSSTSFTTMRSTGAAALDFSFTATASCALATTAGAGVDFALTGYGATSVPVAGLSALTFSLSATAAHINGLNQTGFTVDYRLAGTAVSWETPLELNPFLIEVWSKSLTRQQAIGDPVYAAVTPRWPGVSSAEVQLKVTDAANAFLQMPGARITVQYRGEHLFSGWVDSYHGALADLEVVTYEFIDDYTAARDTLAWVAPAAHLAATSTADEAQTVLPSGSTHTAGAADGAGYYDWTPILSSGSCSSERAIKAILQDNWSRLGLPITVVANASRGLSVPQANLPNVRFDPLDTVIEPLAADAALRLKVWQPRFASTLYADVVPLVTWTRPLTYEGGVVQSGDYSIQAPAATRVVVGGPGEDTARAFDQQVNAPAEADWGRKIEVFKDGTTGYDLAWPTAYTDAQKVDKYYPVDPNVDSASRAAFVAALQQVASDQLADSGPTSGLDLTLSETASFHYGGPDGFHVGDTLTVSAGGTTFTDSITECTLTWSATGFTVTPTIGKRTVDPDVLLLQSIQALATSLRRQATGR